MFGFGLAIRVACLRQSVSTWNKYRLDNLEWIPNLRDANLRDADLSGADLSGAILLWSDLSGAILSHADLNHAILSWSDLRWSDLSGSNLSGSNLRGSNLRYASNCLDLGRETISGRGYNCGVVPGKDSDGNVEYRFFAGCRNFTFAGARAHWGSPDYPDKDRAAWYLRRIDFAEKECEIVFGWRAK
jgi:hypothetical protein